jgi:hypothetical protein
MARGSGMSQKNPIPTSGNERKIMWGCNLDAPAKSISVSSILLGSDRESDEVRSDSQKHI